MSIYFPGENILKSETRCQVSVFKYQETTQHSVQSGLMLSELEK